MKMYKKVLSIILSSCLIFTTMILKTNAEEKTVLSLNVTDETEDNVIVSVKLDEGKFNNIYFELNIRTNNLMGIEYCCDSDDLIEFSREITKNGYCSASTSLGSKFSFASSIDFDWRNKYIAEYKIKKNTSKQISKNDIELVVISCSNTSNETFLPFIVNNLPDEHSVQDLHSHKYIISELVKSDCFNDGYILYECEKCGHQYSETIESKGHQWLYELYQKPTCTSSPTYKLECSKCGEIMFMKRGEPLGGEHSFITTVFKPTCTENGYTEYKCEKCDYSFTDNIVYSKGHSFIEQIVFPTCKEQGYTQHICSICGETYNDNYIEPYGCDYSDETTVFPTCTESGYTIHKCINCDNSYIDDYTSPRGHNCWWYIDSTIDKEPDGDKPGIIHTQCRICGETIYKEFYYKGTPITIWNLPDNIMVGDSFYGKGYFYEISNLTEGYKAEIKCEFKDINGKQREHYRILSCGRGGSGDGPGNSDVIYRTFDKDNAIFYVPGTLCYTFNYYNSNNTLVYSSKKEIKIRQPIINDNAPEKALVGTTYTFTTSLNNTSLTNESVSNYSEALLSTNNNNPEYVYFRTSDNSDEAYLAYQPEIEIIEGKELIKQYNQDYSNTLNTTEFIKFINPGVVRIRIKYKQINTCGHCLFERHYHDYDAGTDITERCDNRYNFEKIITIIIEENTPSYTLGDINKDNLINSADALLCLRHSIEEITLTGESFVAADVNKDSNINSGDALLILQYSIGKINKF